MTKKFDVSCKSSRKSGSVLLSLHFILKSMLMNLLPHHPGDYHVSEDNL